MKQQGNITAAPITTRPRHHWPRVFPVFCVRPLPVGRNACFWSRSADRTEVSFLREIDGGFREELRAAQGRQRASLPCPIFDITPPRTSPLPCGISDDGS